jgi:hypothetical protein
MFKHCTYERTSVWFLSCILETNLKWNRPYVLSDYLARQQKTWKPADTLFLSINMESSSNYMTWGTLMLSVDWWSSWIFKKDADLSGMELKKDANPSGMEWWSSQSLQGIDVCKMSMPMQCLDQQKIYMRDQQSKASPDPRKQFVTDLILAFISTK